MYCDNNAIDIVMDVILYTVLIFTIRIYNVTGKDLEIDMLRSLVLQLTKSKPMNVVIGENYTGEMCKSEDLPGCYEKLFDVLEKTVETSLIPTVNDAIVRLLNDYNDAVLTFVESLELEVTISNLSDGNLSTIDFKDSKVYCVIGFLKLANVNVDKILGDYIFFNRLRHLKNINNKTVLVSLLKTHSTSRKSKDLNVQLVTAKCLQEVLEMKLRINQYSQPFCDLGTDFKLKWMTADAWLWKELETSQLLSETLINRQNIFKTPFNLNGSQNRETLSKIFSDQNENVKFDKIGVFHDCISSSVDNFVFKVLSRTVVIMLLNDMSSFYNQGKDINPKKVGLYCQALQNIKYYFLNQVRIFKDSLEFYISIRSNTFDEATKSIPNVINSLIISYKYQFYAPINWQNMEVLLSTNKEYLTDNSVLGTDLDDSQYKYDDIDNANANSKCDLPNLIAEMKKVNIALSHLIEIILEL